MKPYIWGFIAGTVLGLGFIFMALGYQYMKGAGIGPCPELSRQESLDMIMKYVSKPGVLSRDGKTDYDDIELVEDEPGYGDLVYTKKDGKRVSRYAPTIICGNLEWARDPDFKPEK